MGYRNQYDIALNQDGELFTYDADMEWDFGCLGNAHTSLPCDKWQRIRLGEAEPENGQPIMKIAPTDSRHRARLPYRDRIRRRGQIPGTFPKGSLSSSIGPIAQFTPSIWTQKERPMLARSRIS